MKKFLAAVALAAMALTTLAGPAAAHGSDVSVFQGFARVGRDFVRDAEGNSTCTQAGLGVVTGKGLYFPAPVGEANVTGTWALNTTTVRNLIHGTGSLNICGYLRPEPNSGIGAACGVSQGYGGIGRATFDGLIDPAGSLDLVDVGWVTSAGGTLPTTGKIVGGGSLVSITQAQGGSDCILQAEGAKQFTVVGVSVLTDAA